MRRLSREEWIQGAFDALCTGGIDALKVELLAKHLGVTKGSFYHHFQNRRELHLGLLEEWERLGTSAVIDLVESRSDDPVVRLRSLGRAVFAPNDQTDEIETAIRSWAQHDEAAAAAAARIDARRLVFVSGLLEATGVPKPLAGRRAKLLYRALIGEFLWRGSGGPTTTRREIDELVDLLVG